MKKFLLPILFFAQTALADAPVIWSGTTAKWLPSGLQAAGLCKMASTGVQTVYTTDGIVKMSSGVPGAAASGTDYQAPISSSGAVSNQFVTGFTAPNTFTRAQPACSNLSDAAASCATDATNANNINSGKLGLARGGTNADLSATGGASQVLKQVSAGAAVTVARLACSDLSDAAASCATDATNASNLGSGTVAAARMPAFSGDFTTSAGSTVATLATVATPATCTNATVTINAKGLVTSCSSGSASGGSGASVLTKTASYVIQAADFDSTAKRLLLECNCQGTQPCTMTLPAASNSGYDLRVINIGTVDCNVATQGTDTFGSTPGENMWRLIPGGAPQSSQIFTSNGGTRWNGF